MNTKLSKWKPTKARPFDEAAACHLLRRSGLSYGSPEEVAAAVERGLEETLDTIFDDREPDPGLLRGVPSVLGQGSVERLRAWWMALLLTGKAPLVERVALLWHGHFATSNAKVNDVRAMYAQNRLFREQGLGDFRVLLHETARDGAMLRWLDADLNRKGAPNENFARELFELFALGRGNYTEADIQEAARAFTGLATEGGRSILREKEHDAGLKTVFGETGAFRGEDIVDRVLAHEACPRFVASRLLTEFGPDSLAAEEKSALCHELGAILVEEDWRIDRTLRRLFESKFFFEHRADRISSPVELVVQTARRLNLRLSPMEGAELAASLGQALFEPPTVKGWDGGRTWIDAGTWIRRVAALESAARRANQDMLPNEREALLRHLLPEASLRERVETACATAGELQDAEFLAAILTAPEAQLT